METIKNLQIGPLIFMGEWGVTTAYKEYDCKSASSITTINATVNKTDQEEQGDDKPFHK